MGNITRGNKFAIQLASVWGTAVEPTTGDSFYVSENSPPKRDREVIYDGEDHGREMAMSQNRTTYQEAAGSFGLKATYEAWEKAAAAIMGHYDSSAPEAGVVTHRFKFDTLVADILHTIGWQEGTEIKAINTAIITAMAFTIENGALKISVEYLGDTVAEKTSAWTDVSDWNYSSTQDQGLFKLTGCVVRMNQDSGSALAAGDKIYPSNIEIRFERGYVTPPNKAGSTYAEKPNEVGPPNIMVTFDFPEKNSTNKDYFADFNDGEYKKLDIQFTGPTISGKSTAYDLTFNFPKLAINEAPEYTLESPIPNKLTLKALKASSYPSGMNEVTPYFTLTNEIAALSGYPAEATS